MARDVEHALHEAFSFGITLFDVSADADSERLAGTAVREHGARDRVVLATRVPLLTERVGRPRRDVLPERLPPPHVQDRIEAALRATRLDALPLAQLPLQVAWLASSAWPELVGTCARLVREGKVLAWGALLDDAAVGSPAGGRAPAPGAAGDRARPIEPPIEPPPTLATVIHQPWLAALSVVYNLCDRRAEPLFELAAQRKPPMAILARQPLAGSALAGNLGPGVRLTPRDDRNSLDEPTLIRVAAGAARLSRLVKRAPPAAASCDAARAAAEHTARPEHLECADVAELALRFAIDRAGVALPRLHRREHLLPAVAAATAPPLSAEIGARALEAADASIH
jgi:aryl-alcohol dehydrogenase-like predicted oxidoreductase